MAGKYGWPHASTTLTTPDVKLLAACLGKSTIPSSPPRVAHDLRQGAEVPLEKCPRDCRAAIATPDADRHCPCRAMSADLSRGRAPAFGNRSSALAPGAAITICWSCAHFSLASTQRGLRASEGRRTKTPQYRIVCLFEAKPSPKTVCGYNHIRRSSSIIKFTTRATTDPRPHQTNPARRGRRFFIPMCM